jgi:hypothetical protein
MKSDIVNKHARPKPVFGALSVGIPIFGLLLSLCVGTIIAGPSGESGAWAAFFVFIIVGFFSVVAGLIMAVIGLCRKERLKALSWIGLIINLLPVAVTIIEAIKGRRHP